jgi:hypothetical protein
VSESRSSAETRERSVRSGSALDCAMTALSTSLPVHGWTFSSISTTSSCLFEEGRYSISSSAVVEAASGVGPGL